MTAESILLYFNIGGFIIIGMSALFGFFKGIYKTTFFFFASVIILVSGWFLMPYITRYLMAYDISRYNINFQGVDIVSLKESIPKVAIELYPSIANVLIEDSTSLAFLYAFVQMILNIVFIILIYILSITIFKFFVWIIWLIIKPRKKVIDGKKVRVRKSIFSRLSGAVVGTIEGIFIIILVSIPLSGLMSIGKSMTTVIENNAKEQELAYQLVVTDDDILLLENKSIVDGFSDEDIKLLHDLFYNYRTTSFGRIAGAVKINDNAIDELIFDELFSIKLKVEDEDIKVKLRKDLEIISSSFTKIFEIKDGKFELKLNIENVTSDEIRSIFKDLSSLDMIEVVIPVGLEYIVNSGEFNDLLDTVEGKLKLEELKKLDFISDITLLGDIFADAVTLIEPGKSIKELNYLAFDSDTIIRIFTNASSLDSIQYIAPISMDLLLDTNAMNDFLIKYQIDKDSIISPDKTGWINDISNIGLLYEAFQGLGINDLEQLKNIKNDQTYFENLSDESVINFVDKLFDFKLVNENKDPASKLLFEVLDTVLPSPYKNIISLEELSNNFNSTEATNLLLLSKVVMKSGAFNEDFEYTDLLTDENIINLSNYLTSSNMVTNNVDKIVNGLLTALDLNFSLNFPDDIDWKSQEGKDELQAILLGSKEILETNILTPYPNFDLSTLEDSKIESIATYFSNSKVIKTNLNTIFGLITPNLNLKFEIILPDNSNDWTFDEISSTLKASKKLHTIGGNVNAILQLEENDLDNILKSKVISRTIVNTLKNYTAPEVIRDNIIVKPAGILHDLLIIDGIEDENLWYDQIDQDGNRIDDGELRKLITSIKLIIDEDFDFNDPASFSVDKVLQLSDGEIDKEDDQLKTLLSSIVLKDSIINRMIKYSIDSEQKEARLVVNLSNDDEAWLDQYDLNDNRIYEGELRRVFKSVKLIYGDNIDLENFNLDLNLIFKLPKQDINYISKSKIIADTASANIDNLVNSPDGTLKDVMVIPENIVWQSTDDSQGELEKLLLSITILNEEEVPIEEFTMSNIMKLYAKDEYGIDIPGGKDNQDLILSSKIIFASIIKQIEDEAAEPESQITIPNNVVWDGPNGELRKLINALSVIVPSGEIETMDINLTNVYVKKDEFGNVIENGTYGQDTVLTSLVISNSIIKKVNQEAVKPDSMIAIPEDVEWFDYGETPGELRNLINALELFIPDGNFDNIDIDISKLYAKDENGIDIPGGKDNQDIALNSKVLFASIVKQIEDEAAKPESQIMVPSDIVWDGTNGELRKLINALSVIVPSGEINDLDVDMTSVYLKKDEFGNLLPNGEYGQNTVLSSIVIEESIINKIENEANKLEGSTLVIPYDDLEFNWYGVNGELRKLINGLSVISPDGRIDNITFALTDVFAYDEFGNEKLKGLDNQNTLLASKVISASIVNRIKEEAETPDSPIIIPNEVIMWNDYIIDGNLVPGELRLIINGLNNILGNKDIDEVDLDISNLLHRDFEIILTSKVLEHSIVDKAKMLITSGELASFVESSYQDREYDWYKNVNPNNIGGDLQPLLEVLRDIGNDEYGISYSNINYLDILSAVSNDEKAESFSNLLLKSNIIENSLDKMFTTILSQGGFDSNRITIDSSGDPTFWRGDDSIVKEGELVLLLQGLNELDKFENLVYSSINETNQLELSQSLKKVNKSSILRQILGDFIDKGLSSADEWKSSVDPKLLTKEEWDTEIDVLVEMLVFINDPSKSISLNDANINIMSNVEADNFGELLKLVARSRLLDINKLSEYMSQGILTVFSDVTFTNSLGIVSTYPNPDTYNDKVLKWNGNDSQLGEIDRLVIVIKKLASISPLDLNMIETSEPYAISMGEFFNSVKESVMLKPVLTDLISSVVPSNIQDIVGPFDDNTNYVDAFIEIHQILQYM